MNTITISGLLLSDPYAFKSKAKQGAYFTLSYKYMETVNNINIIAFDSCGDSIIKTLHKGNRIIVSGRLQIIELSRPAKHITDIIVSTYERVIKLNTIASPGLGRSRSS